MRATFQSRGSGYFPTFQELHSTNVVYDNSWTVLSGIKCARDHGTSRRCCWAHDIVPFPEFSHGSAKVSAIDLDSENCYDWIKDWQAKDSQHLAYLPKPKGPNPNGLRSRKNKNDEEDQNKYTGYCRDCRLNFH